MRSGWLLRYWHTLRHLRPVQFFGRLKLYLPRPRPDLSPAPVVRKTATAWTRCQREPSMLASRRFRLLSVVRSIDDSSDWNRSDWPRLWLYNAHYFDDLTADNAEDRTAWHAGLIARWINENPQGQGIGWDPYPCSLRIVNWVKWALAGHALDDTVRLSLAVQARFLRQRLEIHLLGNHLWANAKALVFAGTFFTGSEADAWRDKGQSLLRRELAVQILSDGGHFENSPMYHATVLEDVLDLLQLSQRFPGILDPALVGRLDAVAVQMLQWLGVMSHPDGGIAFFNDSVEGIAPRYAALVAYASELGIVAPVADSRPGMMHLPATGYVRMVAGNAVLLADVGELGPNYLPGHAHADTLSFEWSLGKQRILVNGGTSTYEAGAERLRQRGTAMHNTVIVDGQDSSEVWGSFRVARRARPSQVASCQRDGQSVLEASHDGYLRLSGKVIHRREWKLVKGSLIVTDHVEGRFGMALARFRLHPSLLAEPQTDCGGVILSDDVCIRWNAIGASSVRVLRESWHPRFGESQPCDVIEVGFSGPQLRTSFHWKEKG